MKVRIYEVQTEHTRWGSNWSKHKVSARTLEEALRKAKTLYTSGGERPESVNLLASAD